MSAYDINITKDFVAESTREAVDVLVQEFLLQPTLFYTEHDLASRLYTLIQQQLGYAVVKDGNGNLNYLVHHEWPTPFRCDMGDKRFAIIAENHPDYGKYRRGHYDIAVFNPDFLAEHPYEINNGQTFAKLRNVVTQDYDGAPVLLFAIELMFRRTVQNGVDSSWGASVRQDCRKLEDSSDWNWHGKFLGESMALAFDAFPNNERFKEYNKMQREFPFLRYIAREC